MITLSILDLSPITEGGSASLALANTLDLARHAESWGFKRYWLAEHHNMTGIASAATAVAIGHVAGGTSTIRVGAGGVMLPNHAPLVIAEQFGTLEALYPGRIDLGLGRAPGTDQRTAQALRRTLQSDANEFPRDVMELQHYFKDAEPGQFVQAVPGAGLKVPLYILGSSLFGARLAAMTGLPYAFASHFAPAAMMQAIELYRAEFQPSEQLSEPYVMVGFNVFAGESDAEAIYLRSSSQQSFLNLRRGQAGPLPPPVEGFEETLTAPEKMVLDDILSCSVAGSGKTVLAGVQEFAARTQADELIVTSHIFDHANRLRSFEILADVGIAKS
ncbi:MAG: LLM class flavin-dependent oxidoreductase [Rhodospirillaceae bacterium]|nr:LLM class flavin-dependent oxidoreductase [Rhodospirillaceae bacterium]MBT5779091.1 LLM class flavin-dependent oxidoreductase [Rhodospirillaceae bacterium]MBT6828416.1 LLM class flavin-dependent oxidoreductase [Rhodospirillaceae bacterium]